MEDNLNLMRDLIDDAKKKDVFLEIRAKSQHTKSVSVQKQKVENIENSEDFRIQFVAFKKNRRFASSFSEMKNAKLIFTKTLDFVSSMPEVEFVSPVEVSDDVRKEFNLNKNYFEPYDKNKNNFDVAKLDIYDEYRPTTDYLIKQTIHLEKKGLEAKGISSSSACRISFGESFGYFMNADDIFYQSKNTGFSISAEFIATSLDGTNSSSYSDYYCATHYEDLPNIDDFAQPIVDKALASLNPQKIKSGNYPVIFSHETSRSIIRDIINLTSSQVVLSGTGFLTSSEVGQKVFSESIIIIDNPLKNRGLQSRLLDCEINRTSNKEIINKGVFNILLYDNYYAKKNKTKTTGNAVSVTSGGAMNIGCFNPELLPGTKNVDDMIKSIDKGIYVTSLIGFGFNKATGDFSNGAVGFLIENGKISYPISGFTVAGNFREMFNMVEVSNYMDKGGFITSPHLMFESVVVGGI